MVSRSPKRSAHRTLFAVVSFAALVMASGCTPRSTTDAGEGRARPSPSVAVARSPFPTPGKPRPEPDCDLPSPRRSSETVLVYLHRPSILSLVDGAFVASTRRLPSSARQAPLTHALSALFAGMTARERRAGCSSAFWGSRRSGLRQVYVDDGRAVIDLRGDVGLDISEHIGSGIMMRQIYMTAFQFPAVREVEFRVDGSCEEFGERAQALICIVIPRPS